VRRPAFARAALALLLGTAACRPGPADRAAAAPDAAIPTGTLRGHVKLRGAPPAPRAIDRHSDPFCAQSGHVDESIVVGPQGGLRDVLLHLTGSLPAAPGAARPPALFEQHECTYLPRLLGLVAGQRLEVKNQDGTLHNVHVFRDTQTLLNRAQKIGSGPVGREVPGPPALLEVKCDVHPWMIAHAYVSEHPWFAATGPDGAFEIRDVPAGHRTVELWHEVYGTMRAEVEIPAGGAAQLELDFAADAPNDAGPSR